VGRGKGTPNSVVESGCTHTKIQKLAFYKYYKREKVVMFLKKKMKEFYKDCPANWQKPISRAMDLHINAFPVPT
jgi:hypothetical protein